MPWLIVIGNRKSLDWVFAEQRMAFKDSARISDIVPGEEFALYVSAGVGRGSSRIVGIGGFASGIERRPATVDGETFDRSCKLEIRASCEPPEGLPFQPLVVDMAFIRKKRGWAGYLHRTLVPIGSEDYSRIERFFVAYLDSRTKLVPAISGRDPEEEGEPLEPVEKILAYLPSDELQSLADRGFDVQDVLDHKVADLDPDDIIAKFDAQAREIAGIPEDE
jgi:hypothetical protein